MDKRREYKVDCPNGCGGKFGPAGLAYHTKFCTGPGYKAGHSHSEKGSHNKKARRANLVTKAKSQTYIATYAPKTGVETVYEIFKDDAAMFSILCHLMSAKAGHDVMNNLEAAKSMIDLKIMLLEE